MDLKGYLRDFWRLLFGSMQRSDEEFIGKWGLLVWMIQHPVNLLKLVIALMVIYAGIMGVTSHLAKRFFYDHFLELSTNGLRVGDRYVRFINSNEGWQNTGIELTQGDVVSITAEGMVNPGFPTFKSSLGHELTLCDWEIEKIAWDRPERLPACYAYLETLKASHWRHDKKNGAPTPEEMRHQHLHKLGAYELHGLRSLSDSNETQLHCACQLDYYKSSVIGDRLKIEANCREAKSGPPADAFDSMKIQIGGQIPDLSALQAMPGSCLRTWLLKTYIEGRFGFFHFAGPDGAADKDNYSPSGAECPEDGHLFPHYEDDSAMLCKGFPQSVLVTHVGRGDPKDKKFIDRARERCAPYKETKGITDEGLLWLAINDADGFFEENIGTHMVMIQVDHANWWTRLSISLGRAMTPAK